MNIDNEFRVNVPIDQAWTILTDIPAIAPCMPGAKLDSAEDGVYAGSVKVKVGPVTADYAGTAHFVSKDAAAHRAELSAKGRESRGSGNAEAFITAQLSADGDGTLVRIDTELKVSGRVAQFGRGVMVDISKKLIGEFVECLEAKMDGLLEPSAGDAETAPTDVGPAPADDEPVAALELMDFAGAALAKRLIPAAVVLLIAYIVYRLIR